MTGNPKGSKWRDGGSRASRVRKKIELSLSAECHTRLLLLAPEGRRSEFVEELIMAAPIPGSE